MILLALALILLLALIGLVFLSTASTERISSTYFVDDTQAELLVEGIKHAVEGTLQQASPALAARPQTVAQRSQPVDAWTEPLLAARVPVRLAEIVGPWEGNVAADNAPPRTYVQGQYVEFSGRYWVCRATHLASPECAPPALPYWLDCGASGDAPVWPGVSRISSGSLSSDPLQPALPPFAVRSMMFPTSLNIGGRSYPALRFYHPGTDRMETALAADTDGDGIADCPLTPVPLGSIHGVTFFYGLRVIDNGSAINASVAWEPDDDLIASHGGQLFPSHLDLRRFLRGGQAELDRLNACRFGGGTFASGPAIPPVDDLLRVRTDFQFLSPRDALWMQLGRRMENPWYSEPPAGARAAGRKFTSLPESESGNLAYKGGVIANPCGPSLIERLLAESVFGSPDQPEVPGLPVTAYGSSPTGVRDWFAANFDYLAESPGSPSGWKPRRPLLTTRNPVSDLAPGLDMRPLAGTGKPSVATTSADSSRMPFSAGLPPLASANTASFGELWRAYWNVMAEDWNGPRTPFGDWYRYRVAHSPAGTFDDPYLGTRFVSGTFQPVIEQHPARMFRSPLRAVRSAVLSRNLSESPFGPDTPRLEPDQVLLLRSALAAINTIALRRPTDDIPWQDIHLSARVGGSVHPVTARIYGIKKQPFLTEIYAQTDTVTSSPRDFTIRNPAGYVAIELHNPYPFPIDLAECRLATIYRKGAADPNQADATAYPNLTISDLSLARRPVSLANARSNLADADQPPIRPTVVPPNGFLVLENYEPRDPSDPARDPQSAVYRPPSSGLPLSGRISASRYSKANFAFVPNLDLVLDREVVLLRPTGAQRLAERIHGTDYDGKGAPMLLRYHGTGLAADLVPLDSFDFTGLPRPYPGDTACFAWHYARASHRAAIGGDEDHSWHFVYPGRYDAGQPALPGGARPRQQGTQIAAWNAPGGRDPWIATPPSPGMSLGDDGCSEPAGMNFQATYPTEFAIPLAEINWAGPPPAGPTGNRYPFGAFARRTDLLRVTFIGAYRLQLDARAGTERVLELNAVTADSVFAEDTDTSDDSASIPGDQEHIG
ncbi:MAG: hypothetical protein ACHRHE_08695, partial [Tepidisphaerales bacterium]